MSGLDNKVIFFLKGDTLKDTSNKKVSITPEGMSEAQVEQEENDGVSIKCINFNTTGCLKFDLDGNFLNDPWTIDWWEKDTDLTIKLSSVFTNTVESSGCLSIGFIANGTGKRNHANFSSNGTDYFIQNHEFGVDKENIWVHRACVYDGNKYRFFQDGKLHEEVEAPGPLYVRDKFQMGRWRVKEVQLAKKIYNFRVSTCVRWKEDFIPQKEVYTKPPLPEEIEVNKLTEEATLSEIASTLVKLKEKVEAVLAISTITKSRPTLNNQIDKGTLESYEDIKATLDIPKDK